MLHPRSIGLAVAPALLAHAVGLLLCAASSPTEKNSAPRIHMAVRLVESAHVGGLSDRAAVPAQLALITAVEVDSSRARLSASSAGGHKGEQATAGATHQSRLSTPVLHLPWASPDYVTVRVPPQDLETGPSQAILRLTVDENGQAVDLQSEGAPLPAAFEQALRSVLHETRFTQSGGSEGSPSSSLRVQARFESDRLAY